MTHPLLRWATDYLWVMAIKLIMDRGANTIIECAGKWHKTTRFLRDSHYDGKYICYRPELFDYDT